MIDAATGASLGEAMAMFSRYLLGRDFRDESSCINSVWLRWRIRSTKLSMWMSGATCAAGSVVHAADGSLPSIAVG
jgi:hypothetical protein